MSRVRDEVELAKAERANDPVPAVPATTESRLGSLRDTVRSIVSNENPAPSWLARIGLQTNRQAEKAKDRGKARCYAWLRSCVSRATRALRRPSVRLSFRSII